MKAASITLPGSIRFPFFWDTALAKPMIAACNSGEIIATSLSLPLGFRPEPGRFPPLFVFLVFMVLSAKFEPLQVFGAANFVTAGIGVSENQSFPARCADFQSIINPVACGYFCERDHVETACFMQPPQRLDMTGDSNHSFLPISIEGRRVKNCKSNIRAARLLFEPVAAKLNRNPRALEPFLTGPNLAIQGVMRKSFSEPGRSFNDVAVSSPKLCSIPKSAAAIKLLHHPPAVNVGGRPVCAERHHLFVHAKSYRLHV